MDLGRTGPGGPAAALAAALPRGPGSALAGRARRTEHPAAAVRPDLEQVFRADYPWVVATAARVLGSRDEAEDVAQEVFLAFSRSTVPAGEARGWLSVAAVHTALNVLRSGRRRATREAATAVDEATGDVADTVAAREEHSRLRALLVRLPHKQAAALVLRHSGLSYAEIAGALDMAPGSVGTTIRRAESALREEWVRHASSE
ncbi:sigma-70 family RNA polymerase sigma factor [Geodermatophilus sp. DSM 44513]|uniref:sigma-70 family RNA polymerase sigma factor n=1 Tax=Geodermatophilus sp. DSM 44513 TaxID=1528104 RepID=UPI00127AD5FE|nr:sigma-70 family RNA polymerase sigma factor [Geodermatophilus sp. DSM 44513]WNV76880.1 sigma-70 family RNA polymerase sigma factor [Geodermatophilus sp. DSM 44513]